MNFTTSVKTCLQKYFVFTGRASRSEFWYFQLFLFLVGLVAGVIDAAIFGSVKLSVPEGAGFIEGFVVGFSQTPILRFSEILPLLFLLPSIAVGARRLHDINHSGKWQIGYVLYVPAMWLIVLMKGNGELTSIYKYFVLTTMAISGASMLLLLIFWIRKGMDGANKYGENPQYHSDEIDVFE